MLTYYNQVENEAYSLNEYFNLRLDPEHILVTTRHGGWAILSNEEYAIFKSNKFEKDSELFKKLEEVGIILTQKSIRKVIFDLKQENSFLLRYANYHVISITNKCNLKCVYCHPDANPKKEEMDEDIAKKVLDFIFTTPQVTGNQIVIEGGEPLLRWDLVKFLYEEAWRRSKEKNLKLRFSFGTNLTLMDEEIAKELSKTHMNPCTSLDGPKELHDKQRPYLNGKGSYDDVIHWITVLKQDFNIKLHALPVITNYSLKFNPEDIINEYIRFGQGDVFFKPFRPSGRAFLNLKDIIMKPEDFYNFWKKGIEYSINLCKKGVNIKETNAVYFLTNILSPNRPSMCHRRPCGAGVSILSYNCDGTINGCDAARNEGFLDLGHVNEDNYQTIRAKIAPLLTLSADSIPICSSCPFMAYCNICLCCNWGYENDIYPKPPRSFECGWLKKAFTFLFKKMLNKEDAQVLRSWSRCNV